MSKSKKDILRYKIDHSDGPIMIHHTGHHKDKMNEVKDAENKCQWTVPMNLGHRHDDTDRNKTMLKYMNKRRRLVRKRNAKQEIELVDE